MLTSLLFFRSLPSHVSTYDLDMDSTDDDKDDDDDLALVVDLGFRMTLEMIVAPREDNFLVPNIILYTQPSTLNESIVFSLYVMSLTQHNYHPISWRSRVR